MKLLSIIFFLTVCITPLLTAQEHGAHTSAYVSEQKRTVKSLSDDDINAIRNGEGWGLAKAAELNGYPGPLHVLQMKDEIELSEQQRASVELLYNDMKAKAIEAGETYLAAEMELDKAFKNQNVDQKTLSTLTESVSIALGHLRTVHLGAHLQMMEILSSDQIDLYNRLRGYSDDPCASVPAGHDPVMWRKHNGCEEN